MIAAERLDVVVISTPMHTHLPLAEQALATGAHVLLEKPPTPTLDEFHRLVSASAASGAGGAARVPEPGLDGRAGDATRLIADGAIGEPVRLRRARHMGAHPRRTGAARRGRAGERSTTCRWSTVR